MAIVSVSANGIYRHSRETAALAHVRTLQNAQTQFYSIKRRFAPSLKDLGPASAKLIPEHLAAGTLGGYHFEVSGAEETFRILATPEPVGKGGASYYSDDSLVIRQNDQGPADGSSPPVK